MTRDPEIRIRPGRIRSTRVQQSRPFVAQVLAATQKAGGTVSRRGTIGTATPSRSRFGRGQRAAVQANRLITSRSRGAVIKARVVRHGKHGAPLGAHLAYLGRDGVTRDGEKGQLFGAELDQEDQKGFADRCEGDRHHFRFIISPDDAPDLSDLRGFTRDLVTQMEKDLGTRLDWVAVDHWNTEHPHVHLIVRGVRDDGADLVIARDYIKDGMRDRARELITQDLGPRSDLEIRTNLLRQIDAERWTNLDRQLARDATRTGVIDLAPDPGRPADDYSAFKIGRLRKLETLGLAEQLGPGQWRIAETAEATLREMGERDDIIKRIHRGLADQGIERGAASYVLAGESIDAPIIGRLVERGLDDELKGTAYAVVDGVDGRTHHIRLGSLEAAGDGPAGSIVELRRYDDAQGQRRVALAVRSDLSIAGQIKADGATWLDRQAIARDPLALGAGGFGSEVREAMDRRAEHLIDQGLAERRGRSVIFARNLLRTLRTREVQALGERLASATNAAFEQAESGDYVTGTYRQRFALASGRFAMIDEGLGFKLVPWSPSMDSKLGQPVSGVARSDGGVDWSFGRKRGLGL